MEDFIVVDEGGDFSYYPSEAALLKDFEYVNEAACIIDRAGNTFGLALDPSGALHLGKPFGPVEGNWLRQTWKAAQHRNIREHPLQRFDTGGRETMVGEVFELMLLEASVAGLPSWVVNTGAEVAHPANIKEVDRLLEARGTLEPVTVHDPYGHCYRPRRHRGRSRLPFAGRSIFYVEVPCQHQGASH